jgi:hypothetical protein
VGKKPCEKHRKTRSFQWEEEIKPCNFFNGGTEVRDYARTWKFFNLGGSSTFSLFQPSGGTCPALLFYFDATVQH